MRKLNIAAATIAAMMLAAALPQAAFAAAQIPAGALTGAPAVAAPAAVPAVALPAVADPSPQGQVDDFVRPEPPANRIKSEYTYVSAPLAGTMKTTLVTVQLADKSAADTDAAVPMAAAQASLSAANGYWANATVGRVDISLTAARQLHKSAAKSTQTPAEIVDTVSQELGWTQGPYTALVMFIPGAYLNNGAAGMTYSNGNMGGRILMPQNSRLTTPVLTHEFGHALGMDHANSLLCGSGAMDVASGPYAGFADSTCSIKPYGDNLDLMGISHWDIMPEISASFWEMGRFGNGDEIANLGTVSAPRSVGLKPWAGTGANRAAKFTDPKSGEVYYLELRAPVGYDTAVAQAGNRGVKITQQGGGNSSILLPPDTRASAFNGYYSNTQAWQAGQTFTTHAGTRVSIDSVSNSAAAVTIRPPGAPPVGSFDSAATSVSSTGVFLKVGGWAVDQVTSSASTQAHVYVTAPDGTKTGYAFAADQPRADVNAALGISGNHGFQGSIALKAAGTYQACAFAIGAFENTALGCRTVALAGTPAPDGALDTVTTAMEAGQPKIKLRGWAADRGTPTASIPVHVYVTNPQGVTTGQAFTANQTRQDVNQALGITGAHGFGITLPVTGSGDYKVCAYGIAVSALPAAPNTALGCQTITAAVAEYPRGYLDSVTVSNARPSAALQVAGWAYDPGTPSASIPIHLYVTAPDGVTTVVKTTAIALRSDVNAAMKITGSHGYRATIPVTGTGIYRVCAYGIAVSALTKGNAFLGCQDASATAAEPPVGYVDDMSVDTTNPSAVITASGWSFERATPSASNAVHIYVTAPDGKTTGYAFTANQPRDDVNAAFSLTGRHGFKNSIPITQSGQYRVCAYGISVSPISAGNTLLGCRDLSARAAPAAMGYLDTVGLSGTTANKSVTATGWTVDPGFTSRSVPVNISVKSPDATSKSYKFTANVARPDVNAALNITGNHGYRTAVPISVRGKYTVCSYSPGISVLTSGVSQLGCKSIIY
ncbi:hypothetical protein [Pseudarthrobacter sp. S9]|uniref:hypothetical protein n=1 Tax=Pseudarthrobacter sp. S9 TaxID=3418421 RepID=UPI003D0574D5